MQEDLKIIKKKYGEDMMHYCRDTFSIILEEKGRLSSLLLNNFETNHDLFKDIESSNKILEFKSYIYSLFDIEREKVINTNKSPKELFESIGYDFYEVTSEEEIQYFKKYYAKGEELCTFNGNRLEKCYVFWVVKKDVDNIKREDYHNPSRQDKYGTSVMSIQFTKDELCTLSIKNRYNHRVTNPDSTYSNNLDNIVPGLTDAFCKSYGLTSKNKCSDFEIPQYVLANDGKYYKYNFEWNNIYYCPGNIIIDNFNVVRYDKEKYILMDNILLDLMNKEMFCYDMYDYDGLVTSLSMITKISVRNDGEEKNIIISQTNGEEYDIRLDKDNCIIGLRNDMIQYVSNNFLARGRNLKKIHLDNLEYVGNGFLASNRSLTEISLPKVWEVGRMFLFKNEKLENASLPNLVNFGRTSFNSYFLDKFDEEVKYKSR